ncbi:DNA-binding response regulator, OmpR family, containings REC and winged-helix (plasmid) [Nostoc flagelliforme CCNUN1]|uniref:DNA-binding response regulator, OmpR family, containings REC and winged-helix n=1 Tax=Nostoc flagelliforme CCNUN1 TaxID=2038116 RepID=A0A2K8T8T1_9NOSO|nr:response regulator [Nostoc flagelliforme]AUB44060.1 DNA-binding response regulator, OmpR family, containings REC and winged-helix [Nostoc flagelliforme CCNUN1]
MIIIVVDDEQDCQLLFKQQFRKEIKNNQVQLYFAFSAEEALHYLQDQLTDYIPIILADINMPGMNGLEMLKIIKTSFPNLKVFMITAYDDENNYLTAVKYGADAYITKPIEFNKLKEKILNL